MGNIFGVEKQEGIIVTPNYLALDGTQYPELNKTVGYINEDWQFIEWAKLDNHQHALINADTTAAQPANFCAANKTNNMGESYIPVWSTAMFDREHFPKDITYPLCFPSLWAISNHEDTKDYANAAMLALFGTIGFIHNIDNNSISWPFVKEQRFLNDTGCVAFDPEKESLTDKKRTTTISLGLANVWNRDVGYQSQNCWERAAWYTLTDNETFLINSSTPIPVMFKCEGDQHPYFGVAFRKDALSTIVGIGVPYSGQTTLSFSGKKCEDIYPFPFLKSIKRSGAMTPLLMQNIPLDQQLAAKPPAAWKVEAGFFSGNINRNYPLELRVGRSKSTNEFALDSSEGITHKIGVGNYTWLNQTHEWKVTGLSQPLTKIKHMTACLSKNYSNPHEALLSASEGVYHIQGTTVTRVADYAYGVGWWFTKGSDLPTPAWLASVGSGAGFVTATKAINHKRFANFMSNSSNWGRHNVNFIIFEDPATQKYTVNISWTDSYSKTAKDNQGEQVFASSFSFIKDQDTIVQCRQK